MYSKTCFETFQTLFLNTLQFLSQPSTKRLQKRFRSTLLNYQTNRKIEMSSETFQKGYSEHFAILDPELNETSSEELQNGCKNTSESPRIPSAPLLKRF